MKYNVSKMTFASLLAALVMSVAIGIPASSQGALIAEDSLIEDYEGSSSQPHGNWEYYGAKEGDLNNVGNYDPRDDYSSNAWLHAGTGAGSYSWYSGTDSGPNFSAEGVASHSGSDYTIALFKWTSPVDGTADITFDGSTGSDGDLDFGLLDDTGTEIEGFSVGSTGTFQETVSDVTVSSGDVLYMYGTTGATKTTWNMTTDKGAPIGDGIKVEVIPEPSTVLLLGLAGLLLIKRRRL